VENITGPSAEEDPFGERLQIGRCPECKNILAGYSTQIRFEYYDADDDKWSDVARVFPKPSKEFTSSRVPRSVRIALKEAERTLQADAPNAACVMLG
jgi:hypothetical protein